jgi:hypothetical protein
MPITFSEPATTQVSRNSNDLRFGTGPLAKLYSGGYNPIVLQYPSDLGSAQKGHIVVFTACVTSGAGYEESKTPAFKTTVDKITDSVGTTIDKILGPASITEKTDLFWQPQRIKGTDVISLYMPDTLSFAYDSSYSELSVKDAMQGAVEGIAGAINKSAGKVASAAASAVDSSAAKLALNAAGKAINPMKQLIFDGIDFRSFQMAFQFTPKNAAESEDIKNIIQAFRSHAAPEIQTGAGGMLFNVPDSWIIQFIHLGQQDITNPFITRVKESVLQHIDVNYSPNGIWSTHPDGSPTQINLTLGFKEIQLVDRTQIQNGF